MTLAARSPALLCALWLGLLPSALAAATPPPIVLVSIDTLRSDRLPAYGYRGVETPAIDALARDGILFEHAYSPAPLTLPAHLSMLSGLLPGAHGVRDNLGYRFDASRHPWAPELLRKAGYRTGAMVSAYVLRAESGFAAGFDHFDDELEPGSASDLSSVQRPGRVAVARAKEWLAVAGKSPFFLLVHLYEPHTPYAPESPFRERYRDPYDGEVATADALVGELLAELRRLDLYDRALVLLVSDHGEGLGDHGEQTHGLLLYREAIQVPMIVKLPGGEMAGRRVAAPAQLLDVAPTLLAAAGAPRPAAMTGLPLAELAGSQAPPRRILSEAITPRLHYGWSDLVSVVEHPYHLIEGPDPELYDLAADPRETRNVRAEHRRELRDLRAEANAKRAPLAPPGAEDPETAAKLAALGYLSGRARAEGALADPKAKLPLLEEYRRAHSAFEAGDAAGALPVFRKVVADTPGMTHAWVSLGRALRELGQPQEALTAFQEALELAPGLESAALAAAAALAELGRFDEARRHAELLLAGSPVVAREMLAQIALGRRDFATAEAEARAAGAAGDGRLRSLVMLARALNGQERPGEALKVLEQAERRIALLAPGNGEFRGLYLARGDAYVKLGQPRDAFTAYEQEVKLAPEDPGGYVSLAVLFHAVGRPQDAGRFLRAMIERNPSSPLAFRAAVLAFRNLRNDAEARRVLTEGLRRFPGDAALQALAKGESVAMPGERFP